MSFEKRLKVAIGEYNAYLASDSYIDDFGILKKRGYNSQKMMDIHSDLGVMKFDFYTKNQYKTYAKKGIKTIQFYLGKKSGCDNFLEIDYLGGKTVEKIKVRCFLDSRVLLVNKNEGTVSLDLKVENLDGCSDISNLAIALGFKL